MAGKTATAPKLAAATKPAIFTPSTGGMAVTPQQVNADNVGAPSADFIMMREWWEIVDNLMGGTKCMRDKREELLPKRPLETQEDFEFRLNLATLFPAYSETIKTCVGRIFAKSPVIGDDVPAKVKALLDDVDREGNNYEVFMQQWFSDAWSSGLSHCLVDYPYTKGARSQADVVVTGARPYWVNLKHNQIIGWQINYLPNGALELGQVRVMECVYVKDGAYGTRKIDQVRVLEPGRWATYRRSDKGDGWALDDEGVTTLDFIPLVTLYGLRTGFMIGKPPLLELAYLNLKHYRQQSDRDAMLEIASVPIIVTTGTTTKDEIVIGAKNSVNIVDPNGTMSFVEPTGKAVETGRVALLDLVEEMRQGGAKLVEPSGPSKTATEAGDDIAKETSQLGRMAKAVDDAAGLVLDYTSEWLGLGKDGGSITTQPNLEHDVAPADSMNVLLLMYARGALSRETLFAEAQRRGMVSDEIEWQDELDRIDKEGASDKALTAAFGDGGYMTPAAGASAKGPPGQQGSAASTSAGALV